MIADRVLFIDAEALVLDKPAGLAVHPGPRTPHSLEDMLDALRFGFQRRPSPVHRLDRDTSGCLLLSRNPRAHRRLAAAFDAGDVGKTYWAVVEGVPEGEGGLIDLPLNKRSSRAEGWRMIPDPKGKPAQTRWRMIEQRGGRALVEFSPLSGRTHQIRVHAASGLGAAVVGDPVYGRGGEAMLLHSRRLELPRGDGRTPIDVTAPLPESFHFAGFAPEAADAG